MGLMLNWLKRLFIPYIGNDHRPEFLLAHNIRQLVGVLIGFELILFALPVLNFPSVINNLNIASVLPGVLSSLTNEERQAQKLPTLVESPLLSQVAKLKAQDMATKGYFAHTSPEGKSPWYWFNLVGYSYQSAGENLAVNFIDSQDVTKAWMNSPTHRANIIAGNYREMGTGIATGTYKGKESVFVAQVYARPAKQGNSITLPASVNPAIDLLQKALSSPRQTTNVVLYVVLSIILVSLFLNIAIKFKYQHPDLINNALILVVIIFGLYLMNSYISKEYFETSFTATVL